MEKLYSPATIQRIKDKYGFRLSKSLGQNFLADGNIVNRIIEGSNIEKTDLVVEIGCGIGVLTAAAAEAAAKVIGIEIDYNLMPVLQETLSEYDNIEIINRDFLKTDLNEIINQAYGGNKYAFSSVKIIGNLPYYITTPIIMKVLEEQKTDVPAPDSMTVMLQKEVADRIAAGPGSKIYGAISVAVQYYCNVENVISVPKEVFIPKPKVDSAVIRLEIRKNTPVELMDKDVFFTVIKSGFGQRRKTLLNALTGTYGLDKEEIKAVLAQSDIDPARRAETLDINEFAALANAVFRGIREREKKGD